jgi:hypothetical protein
MIRVQLAKEYRQPDPEGQQTYGKQELLHNGPVVIQQVIMQVWISTHFGVLSEQLLVADEHLLFIKATFTPAPVPL